ncbi:MAG: glycogen debranching N-terminal domain-containing protein, partial [Fulvivirga sp.]
MAVTPNLIKLDEDDKYYISADSTYADDRIQVLNHSDTFGIFDRWGNILPIGKAIRGIYHNDTRYINKMEMKMNGHLPTLLSSAIKEKNEMLSVDLTNPEMTLDNGETLHHGSIHIRRSQFIRTSAFHEKIELTNFNNDPLTISISLTFEGDFKDIFEIRGMLRKKRGTLTDFIFSENKQVTFGYMGLDNVMRMAKVKFTRPFSNVNEEENVVHFELMLKPDQTVSLNYSILFIVDDQEIPALSYNITDDGIDTELEDVKAFFPKIRTANEQFTHWINRSITD